MKLLLLNSFLGFGSTGHIVLDIAKEYEQKGYEVKVAYGRVADKLPDESMKSKYGVRIGNDMGVYFHVIYTRLTDKHGLTSNSATKQFLEWAEAYDPDILWIHNIHGYFINYELLFQWIKSRPNMQVKWTLHDCWTCTGHCAHFTYAKCDRWLTGCHDCPQLSVYPQSSHDNSLGNYLRKKAAFTGVKDLTIITPSNWLKGIVKKSFLAEYPVEVVYNTINKNIFKPTESTFKQDHGFQNKMMILGVSSVWHERKGLNDLIELSRRLDHKNYQIVIVGLSEKQVKELKASNGNIFAIAHTSNVQELVEIYSAADVFVNPTYEDTFPTVNMEAEACGTPVITYNTC